MHCNSNSILTFIKLKGYLREGKGQLCLGDFQSALRCFQKVKDLEPGNTSADIDVSCIEKIA